MILTEIKAKNILKYSTLELTNLPSAGLIGVNGRNESGKTSIGEIICFGLFGRTFSLNDENLVKLIKWGEIRCSADLQFIGKDNKHYRVVRHLDSNLVHGAQLFEKDNEEPVATGGRLVSEQISRLIGFEYGEYIESFYLAQRELRTPSHNSKTIKVMAGIVPLEVTKEEITKNLAENTHIISQTELEINKVQSDLDSLQYDPDRLSCLEDFSRQCEKQADDKSDFLERLSGELEDYKTTFSFAQKLRAGKNCSLVASLLACFLSLEFLAIWWWVNHPIQTGALRGLIQKVNIFVVGGAENLGFAAAMTFGTSVLLGAIFILLIKKEQSLKSKTATLIKLLKILSAENFTDRLSDCLKHATKALQAGTSQEEVASQLELETTFTQDYSKPEKPIRDIAFLPGISQANIEPEQLNDLVHERFEKVQRLCGHAIAQQPLLKRECERERQLGEQAAGYQDIIDQFNEKLSGLRYQAGVYSQAVDLLDKGMVHMSGRFNSDVVNDTARAIPLFTNGHYEHLKIDDQMKLMVFSNEKHDFMDFEELSSGTQRQIMLALRLAMSQKLIHTAATGDQFIFFDEPFAFFDKDRVLSTLKALPDISKDISQIWIVAQEIDRDAFQGVDIRCQAEQDQLIIAAT